jgi:phosphopantetheinyl transferase (holo-ACP synthase)
MIVNMAINRERVTVHTMNPIQGRGPVYYASLQRDTHIPTIEEAKGEESKHCLVSSLWNHLIAMKSPPGVRRQFPKGAAFPIQVARGLLGRPHLLVGAYRGPAISFSEGGEKVWAALSGDESDIGIDAAGADEFQKEYPFHRVFHPEELRHALRSTSGSLENASALIWSIKEAVVKALGCAFHLLEPREIIVYPAVGGDEYTFPVRLSGKALNRFPLAAHGGLWVRSFPQRKMWLSVALLNRRSAGNA